MEDEHLIAMDIEQLCREHGASEVLLVHALDKADQAFAESLCFDAGILDVALAGSSTLDFARRLLAAGIPFVFATGQTDADGMFDDFPGVAVIGKPYAGNRLIAALAAALAQDRPVSGGV